MRYILFFLLLIGEKAVAQTVATVRWSAYHPSEKSDTIYYDPAKKLIWRNFKGTAGEPAEAAALTSSGFGYDAMVRMSGGRITIIIDVYCYFSKERSWVRKGYETDYALNHEQHHFDVTYIVANNFINKLNKAAFTAGNYSDLIEKIYRESCNELDKMQNDYDGQTSNGRLKDIQDEWNKKINQQLSLL
ncbi:hypothetical protein [Ferruginibacter sp.]